MIGGDPIMDFNGSGTLTMRYLWGPTGIVARQTSGGTVSWYLADHLGTVRDLINNSGGNHRPRGLQRVRHGAGRVEPDERRPDHGLRDAERDTVTGLNLAVYREENPGTGRWDSQDPLGFVTGDPNVYRYVRNSATSYQDSTGLRPPILPIDGDGQLMGPVPTSVDPSWGCIELAQALQDINGSIAAREGAMEYEDMFGDGRNAGHIRRKKLEQEFRNKIKDRMKNLDCPDGDSSQPKPPSGPTGSKPTATTTTSTPVSDSKPSTPPSNPLTVSLPWWASKPPQYDWMVDTGIGATVAATVVVGWWLWPAAGAGSGAGAGASARAGAPVSWSRGQTNSMKFHTQDLSVASRTRYRIASP